MSPFHDRGERPRPGEHRADPNRQDLDEPVPHPATRPGILDPGQHGKQINWHWIRTGKRLAGAALSNGDR
jgi:hypothetical protein